VSSAEDFDRTPYIRPEGNQFRHASAFSKHQQDLLVELGKTLFFDPRLSFSGLMSCATCHNPSFHWTDGLKTSIETSVRRTMALYDLAWDNHFMWNGLAGSLASQIIFPLSATNGMNSNESVIQLRIAPVPYYKETFAKLFRSMKTGEVVISIESAAIALDFYVSTIRSPIAPFDHWINGDESALSPAAKRGFSLFRGKAGCANCHSGWRFSDGSIQDIGLKLLPELEKNMSYMKVVGLRNIADRPPFMHDGGFNTLDQVIDFYNRGGDVSRPTKSIFVKPLDLSQDEKKDIKEFLLSLSGTPKAVEFPLLPR
jgi:cytochrome c peroxidase